jgi:XTP/dITP diphosphohydrolase
LLEAPRGQGGFGYDPLFYLPELGRTMAELDLQEKNRLSHRAAAFRALAAALRDRWARK